MILEGPGKPHSVKGRFFAPGGAPDGSLLGRLAGKVMRSIMGSLFLVLLSLSCAWAQAPPLSPPLLKVVIDPGHGGKDKGVSSAQGIMEKDLALALARELREEARAMGGFQVRLTREEDETFPWIRRKDASHGADIWVSIHFNSDFVGKARGPRVFFPSGWTLEGAKGAKSSRSNASDVRAILEDMVATKKANESLLLAEHLQRVLESVWSMGSRPSTEAQLMGLMDLEIPSVLVEVGFLSNPSDLKLVQDSAKRKAIVKAILRGLRAFSLDPRRQE